MAARRAGCDQLGDTQLPAGSRALEQLHPSAWQLLSLK